VELDWLGQDIRFALRGFRRSPTFALTVVLTIALGLGVNASVFTIFNAYVLRPLALRDPRSLYEVSFQDRTGRGQSLSWRQYQELRALSISSESFAYTNVSARSDQRLLFGGLVTGDAFRVLGAAPALGRTLLPEDAAPPGGEAVLVLSHAAWQGKFAGDSGIVGKRVLVHGIPVTVVGVAAKGFTGIGTVPPDFWAPITLLNRLEGGDDLFGAKQPQVLRPVLRLQTRLDEQQARAALALWAATATASLPDSLRWTHVQLTSVASALPLTAETVAMFSPAAVALALVLLIACANVANVMLARGVARQREIGVRLALGAARPRLVRQLLTESVLLALAAAVLGFFISQWTIDVGVRLMFASVPAEFAPYLRVMPLAPDLRVFGFVLVAGLAAAVIFGLAPALQTTGASIVQATRGELGTGFRPGRLRGALVVGQIAMCSLLLIVTGVLLRGAATADRLPTGVRTRDVVLVNLDEHARSAALQRLRWEPIVSDVGASTQSPLDGMYPSLGVQVAGAPRIAIAGVDFVDAGFFRVVGIPIVRGRAFTQDEERRASPVAVVSEAAARALWGERDPIGELVRQSAEPPRDSRLARVRTARVIGVSRNAVSGWIGTGLERPVVFYPASADSAGTNVVARVSGDASEARRRIDFDLSAADPRAVNEIHTLDDYLAVQRWPFRIFSWVALAIGGLALTLTVIGIYGVLSYLVAQRAKEIGIRMALGAGVRDVVGKVLRQSLRYATVGIAAGSVLALLVSRLFASVLVIVNTFDPAGYALGIAVVMAASLAAAWAPSLRAARVNPVEMLREE
jgi:predicted permease